MLGKPTFGRKMTLEEIAKIEGVTRERIRQIEAVALEKLRRHGITTQLLRQFHDEPTGRQYARATGIARTGAN